MGTPPGGAPGRTFARRRALIALAAFAALAFATACGRKDDRCAYCGMKLVPSSPWLADLVRGDGSRVHFDTPRCALLAWRSGRVPAVGAMFQEFYDRTWRKGEDLRFALGSDVMGPMGVDVVPVDPARAQKFATDHHAARIVTLPELTMAVLDSLS